MTKKLLRKDVLKWIRNLSDGSYKKVKGQLTNEKGDKFCCMGVWADQHGCYWRERITNPSKKVLIPYIPEGKFSPYQGYESLDVALLFGLTPAEQGQLTDLNDSHTNWKQVIEYIKEIILPRAEK